MSSVRQVALATLVCTLGGATPAWPCEPWGLPLTTVVGFSADRASAVLRVETRVDGPETAPIELQVYDLATETVTRKYPIVTKADPEAQRPALRGKRWKEAEVELKSQGFTITPSYPMLEGPPFDLGNGVKLAAEDSVVGEGEDAPISYDLFAQRQKTKRTVVKGLRRYSAPPPMTERDDVKFAYLSPDKRFVLLLGGSCRSEVMKVLRVEAVVKALAAK